MLHPARRRAFAVLVSVLAVTAGLLPVVPTAATAAPTRVTKVLTVVVENHSLAQMQAGMPYAFSQARRYGYASNWTALTHPSLPNYVGMVSGTTSGLSDDNPPSSHRLTGRTVFGQARAHGKTARAYVESMPSRCSLSSAGRYAVKHNPLAYFTRERSLCRRFDRSTAGLAADIRNGALPNVGFVVPNECNDAHDCSLATADSWFASLMARVKAGPDWKSGRLAVVLTADEDDRSSGNKVLTVVMHPALSRKVVRTPLTHYSLTRLYDDVIGAPRLNGAATAPDMAAAFGLEVRRTRARFASTRQASATRSAQGVQAAVLHGWGRVVAGDEFSYTGRPRSSKWGVYDTAGQGGKGLRRPSAWHVNGSVATVTGNSSGTTGGMAAKFGHRTYGRWEVRMRTNARDSEYHPVAILWPDSGSGGCSVIDYVEATSDTSLVKFFLHYGCSSQTRAIRRVDMTKWHNFAVEWTPTHVTGYLDGRVWFRDTNRSHVPTRSLHQTLQLDWFPDGSATKLSTMSVDWVRVYDVR